ncbi:MAG: hypothetical protein QXX12_05650 [Nanopusillaceae archaeon]
MFKELVKFALGLVVGFVFTLWFIELVFSEDELHKQISKRAYCKTVEEILVGMQDPVERLEFLEKHGSIIQECERRDDDGSKKGGDIRGRQKL